MIIPVACLWHIVLRKFTFVENVIYICNSVRLRSFWIPPHPAPTESTCATVNNANVFRLSDGGFQI